MKIDEFQVLKGLNIKGDIILKSNSDFAYEIYKSNIPFRPGIYLVYSLNSDATDNDLLYYGKAGVTGYSNNPKLNFHQLPKRLLGTSKTPINYLGQKYSDKKDITRAKLWPWYVNTIYKEGIKIYWFITDWPSNNPNEIEKEIKSLIKQNNPKWKKSI